MTGFIISLPERIRPLFRRRGAAPAALAVLAAILATALGWVEPLEHRLMELRFRLADRPADGNMVVVELDNKSLADMGVWPWPRQRHAALIDRLVQAGVRGIALDIDFSSASTPEGDVALAGALARAEPPRALPVSKQYASLERRDDQLRYTMPLPEFAEQSRLASVNLQPDADGLLRRYSLTQSSDGNLYLSMGAAFAAIDQPSTDGFYLDFGIRPASIPHYSFSDILNGKASDAELRGRFVIVGATAIELGDDVTVPIYRSLPGVTLPALAYESIMQGRTIQRSSPAVTWTIALLLAVLAGGRFSRWPWRRGLWCLLSGGFGLAAASVCLQANLPLSLDIVLWILVLSTAHIVALMWGTDALAARIFHKGMALLHRGAVMRAVFDDSFDGIVIVDEAGRIEHANPAAALLLQRPAESLVGMPAHDLFRDGRELNNQSEPILAAELERQDGTGLAVGLVIRHSPLRRSRRRLERRRKTREISIWTFRDVSERKRAADAQKAALQKAVAADRAKSEFIANMGHELRTPLNAIIGFSEMLKSQVLGPIGKADYIAYAAGINASGLRLLNSVNSILDFACIEGSRYELEEAEVVLADLIENALGLSAEAAKQKGIEIENRCPAISLRADPRAVRQVLANLLSNAVKFTGNDGRIMVNGTVDADGDCRVIVADNGIGMPKEQVEKVLKPFRQAHEGLARKYEGVGLGLSVAIGLMQLHGGTLEIDSVDNVGTTVTLHFPAERVLTPLGLPAVPIAVKHSQGRAATATIHRLKERTAGPRA